MIKIKKEKITVFDLEIDGENFELTPEEAKELYLSLKEEFEKPSNYNEELNDLLKETLDKDTRNNNPYMWMYGKATSDKFNEKLDLGRVTCEVPFQENVPMFTKKFLDGYNNTY